MKNRTVLAGLVMLVTVLSAFAVATPVAAAAAEEDVLYVAMQEDLPDLNNYNLGTNSVWKAHVIQYCFEGLVTTDYDLKTIPLLATGWTFTEATLTVDVDVRQGVTFHDGTPMTAEDVVYSYKMVRDGTTYSDRIVAAFDGDDSGTVDLTEFDAGVQQTGTYSVRFVMAKPYGQFFSSTLAVPIVPKYIWDDPANGFTDADDQVIVSVSDIRMTIGTGCWYYDGGVDNVYRIMRAFPDYWGKGVDTDAGYPLYPDVVDTVYFKIYASIDTAILALQGGDVDYIAWAVTAGRVPSLQSDPNIQLEYMSDSGYFYLAFNMKKEPMNNLTFRKAISHLIDKDQIVDVYMGGFGQAGSAAVPPFFGEWHNPAVTKYAFDVDLAKSLLDQAGYTDQNGDGWRDMPDGSLMEKISLMTPPADYDPIRIKAGQMLATNMRAAGINVEAKPIDFNTLVAKMTSFDYQMLELGWSFTGYTECVSLLFDIYGPKASSNSWAFWTPTNENPYYKDYGGVSTLADATTLAYADEFAALEAQARAAFVTADQINYVKEGQAIIADAIPCNVLYYRVNVEAHNKVWTNWTVFDGTLYNAFCLNVLDYAGEGAISGGGAVTTSVNAGLTLPGKVRSGAQVEATVVAIDNAGKLVADADVVVNVTGGGVVAYPASGKTDSAGVFKFKLNGTAIGESTVRVDVTKGTASDSDSAPIRTYTKGGLAVVVTPEQVRLNAGESMDVSCYVADANGPVQGATVSIDPYLLGYGSITPSEVVTGADGTALMTYTAPALDLLNQHMLVTISASVAKDGYLYTNIGSAGVVVYNDDLPDYMIVSVGSVTTTALSPTTSSTTISVLLTDAAGAPMGSEVLDVVYSNDSRVSSPVTTVTTAADGTADVAVAMADTGESGALRVTVTKLTEPNAISDTVTLTYVDPADPPAAAMYGGYLQFDLTKYVAEWGSIVVTAHVFDSDGNPADGVNATVIMPATTSGQLVDFDASEFNSLWEYAGVLVYTNADEQNLGVSGSFASPLAGRAADYLDYWYGFIPVGGTITAGVWSTTISGADVSNLDILNDIYVLPGSWGDGIFDGDEPFGSREDAGPWVLNFVFYGETMISSQLAYGRASGFTGVRYTIADPVLQARTTGFDTTDLDIWVYDESNAPIEGADAAAYQASRTTDYGLLPHTTNRPDRIPTDANGYATYEIVAASYNSTSTEYDKTVVATIPNMYVRGYVDGTYSLLSQTQLVMEPIVRVAFAAFTAEVTPQPLGFVSTVSAKVVDLSGNPIAGMPVSIIVDGGVPFNGEAVTDAAGMVTFAIDTSELSDVAAGFVAIDLTTGGLYEASYARAMIAVMNAAPTIDLAVPGSAEEVEGENVTVLGSVYDMNGLSAVTMSVDGGTAIDILDTDGLTTALIMEVLEDLDEGDHTVKISATDSLGQDSEVTVSFTYAGEEAGTSMLPWIVAAIGWIVAVALVVFLVMKMRKPAAPAPETKTE